MMRFDEDEKRRGVARGASLTLARFKEGLRRGVCLDDGMRLFGGDSPQLQHLLRKELAHAQRLRLEGGVGVLWKRLQHLVLPESLHDAFLSQP